MTKLDKLIVKKRLRPGYFLLVVLLCIASIEVNGQYYEREFSHQYIPSVDAWNFMQYGNTPVDHHTGQISINIPIYTYEDPDFTIPVALGYSYDGFKPNVPSGSVGLGWALLAGGMITREVRDVPDEYINVGDIVERERQYPGYSADIRDGYYSFYEEVRNDGLTNIDNGYCVHEDDFKSPPTSVTTARLMEGGKYCEVSPDIFSFNFPGHNGQFHMDCGDVKVYNTNNPQGEYKVDLSGFRNEKSKIVITTGDGYIYTFGGLDTRQDIKGKIKHLPYKYREYMDKTNLSALHNKYASFFNHKETGVYSQWPLVSIEAPNGRKVNLNYELETFQSVRPGGYEIISDVTIGKDPNKKNTLPSMLACYKYITKARRLTKITVSNRNQTVYNCKIEFDYSPYLTQEGCVDVGNGTIIQVGSEGNDHRKIGEHGEHDKIKWSNISNPGELRYITAYSMTADGWKRIKSASLGYIQPGDDLDCVAGNIVGINDDDDDEYEYDDEYDGDNYGDYTNEDGEYYDIRPDIVPAGADLYPPPPPLILEDPLKMAWHSDRDLSVEVRPINRLFLRSIHISGEGSYRFKYYHDKRNVYPSHGLVSLDRWGYYDSSDSYILSSYASQVKSGSYGWKGHAINSQRASSLKKTRQGVLRRIEYPTGGYSEFKYELNEVSKYVNRENGTPQSQLSAVRADYAGGLRIKSITDKAHRNDTVNPVVRKFTYEDGVLLHAPIIGSTSYRVQADGSDYSMTEKLWLTTPFDHEKSQADKSLVEYGKVTEELSDGSKIEYRFTTFNDMPNDQNNYQQCISGCWKYSRDGYSPEYTIYAKTKPSSHHMDRGKLKSKKIYSGNDNKLVYEEEYTYNTGKALKYTPEYLHTGATIYKHRIYTESYPLASKTETTYTSNGVPLSKTTSYGYNSLGRIEKVTTEMPSSVSEYTEIKYSDKNHSELDSYGRDSYDILEEAGILNYPLIKRSYYSKDNEWYLRDKEIYSYTPTYPIKLQEIRKPRLTGSIRLNGDTDIANDRVVVSYETNILGRVIMETDEEGISTCYIWGHNGMYPVAVIENKTYDDLGYMITLKKILDEDGAVSGNLTEKQVEGLHNGLTNARITVYEYIPLVGVSRIIDHSRRSTYYHYDNKGKLRAISDDEGNTIETYDYKF